jgi:hypothetical protein
MQVFYIFIGDLVMPVTHNEVHHDCVYIRQLGDGGGETPPGHFGIAFQFMRFGDFQKTAARCV